MAAGMVIHSLAAEQDMRRMGGLKRLMPRTFWAFLVGSLALVGVPPFAGFFSKDSILAAAMDHGAYGYVLWAAGLVGTFLTGLYTFRMLFLVFLGEPSAFAREHVHALRRDVVGVTMSLPVAVLTVLAVIGGWLQFAPFWHPVETWLQSVAEPLVSPTNAQEAVSSILAVVLGLAGIGVAWALYGARARAVPRLAVPQRALERKLWFDEAYDVLFYWPSAALATAEGGVEKGVVQGSISGVVDGVRALALRARSIQTGLVRTYAFAIAASLAVLVLVFVSVR
jgi:NADH-quinone oxidoreductase subunit L